MAKGIAEGKSLIGFVGPTGLGIIIDHYGIAACCIDIWQLQPPIWSISLQQGPQPVAREAKKALKALQRCALPSSLAAYSTPFVAYVVPCVSHLASQPQSQH